MEAWWILHNLCVLLDLIWQELWSGQGWRPQKAHLQFIARAVVSSLGESMMKVATALQSKLSSRTCNQLQPVGMHLLPYWQMGQWWHGEKLKMVVTALRSKEIHGAAEGFAAILADGSVVAWGGLFSFDEHPVPDCHCPVRAIASTSWAFDAILEDGSAFAWGHSRFGGSSNRVQGQLKNVQQIFGSFTAFAAILADGSVVTWGEADGGGDSTAVQDRLRNVQQIQASDHAFAAFLADGTVVSWGVFEEDLDTATYANYLAALRNVQKIQATSNSFAAIHADGSVNCWGSFLAGNNAKKDLHVLGKVVDLSSSRTSFAASMLRDDGYKGIAWWEKMTTLDSLVSDWRSRLVQWLRFSRMILLLLHSWQMDQLFLAALTPMAVTAKTFKISSRTSNSLLPLRWPSAQSLMTEKLLPGVVEMKAATAVQFKENCLHWCESLLLYWLFYNAIFAAPSHCLNFGSFLQCSFYNAILQFSAASTSMAFCNAMLFYNSQLPQLWWLFTMQLYNSIPRSAPFSAQSRQCTSIMPECCPPEYRSCRCAHWKERWFLMWIYVAVFCKRYPPSLQLVQTCG